VPWFVDAMRNMLHCGLVARAQATTNQRSAPRACACVCSAEVCASPLLTRQLSTPSRHPLLESRTCLPVQERVHAAPLLGAPWAPRGSIAWLGACMHAPWPSSASLPLPCRPAAYKVRLLMAAEMASLVQNAILPSSDDVVNSALVPPMSLPKSWSPHTRLE